MVLAHHCIFSFYGFWLPNDPRGSGSDYVGSWELFYFGPATKLADRSRSVAKKLHDHSLRQQAKESLKYVPVKITGIQAVAVAAGFAQAAHEASYALYACAILPEHVHLVIAWHARNVRLVVGHLKSKATMSLREKGLWDDRPLWSAHGWNVRLDDQASVQRAIQYVDANPEKEGKRSQRWSMIAPFDMPRIAASQAAALESHKPLYRKRQIGGAALRSQQSKKVETEESKG
jgi:REP element-mobilizing transposase RayT